MFYLTHRERKILLGLGVLIIAGSILKYRGVAKPEEPSVEVFPKAEVSGEIYPELIDINQAPAQALERISGIVKVIAARIINYRFKYGSFRDLKDLEKVKGIGPKKAEKIKKYVVFK